MFDINTETVNDRAKLIMHRIIARELSKHPELVDEAREALARERQAGLTNSYIDEWAEILDLPLEELCRRIVQCDEQMSRLRISSPFGAAPGLALLGLRAPQHRMQIWQQAKDDLMRMASGEVLEEEDPEPEYTGGMRYGR